MPYLFEKKAPKHFQPHIVEGTLITVEDDNVQRVSGVHPFLKSRHRRAYRISSSHRVSIRSITVISLLVVGLPFLAFVAPSLFIEAVSTTIFLHPQKGGQTHIVTVTASPNEQQSVLRVRTIENTASALAPTTGLRVQAATTAQGVLTFYNTATQSFSLPANVDVVASNGLHVITQAPVTLPASPNFPQFSIATVSARAASAGSAGNLATGAIETQCPVQYCGGSKVTITNTDPFTGGQDSQTTHIVSQADIQQAETPLRVSLNTKTPQMLLAGNQTGEQVVDSTLTCLSSSISAIPAVGSPAIQVRVTASMRCQEEVYQPKAVISRALAQTFTTADNTIHIITQTARITAVENPNAQGSVVFRVTVFRQWETTISPSFVSGLAARFGGKTPNEVRRYLRTNRSVGLVLIEQRFLGELLLPFPCVLASPHNVSIQLVQEAT